MWAFIASDGMGFAGLFAAYAATRAHSEWWPNPGAHGVLNVDLTALNTFILICSSVTMVFALKACRENDRGGTSKWLLATILGGSCFLGVQVFEYHQLITVHGIKPWTDPFTQTFYSLTCYHGMHVLSGVVYLSCIFVNSLRGKYHAGNSMPIEIVGLFWHFVDLVWILLFTFVYLFEPLEAAAH
ncbi:MAG: heme-copper oxidase subunit III [Planctomycetes bacterium]|nr:heme-copper oxidase subunit III [Planctomycetota bacterium]